MAIASDRLELAQANAKAVKLALGITVTQKTKPMSFIRALLDKVGFTLEQRGKVGPRGEQVKNYQILPKDTRKFAAIDAQYSYSRLTIFKHWLEQDKAEASEMAKPTIQQDLQTVEHENPVVLTRKLYSSIPPASTTKSPKTTVPNKQISGGQDRPKNLTQIEQVCLGILQSCDHWGQYLSVAAQVGSEALERLWTMLVPPEQMRIASMELPVPVVETGQHELGM